MKRTVLNLVCGAVVCASIVPAMGLASERAKTPAVNARQQNQQARIRQGIQSGELTRREAARLKEQEQRIRANERRAKADGTVSATERARLEKELARASQNIQEQRHDEQHPN